MQEKYTIFNYKNKRYLIKPSIKVEVEYNKDLWQYFIPVYNILTYGKTKKEVEEKAWEEFYTLYHNKKLGYFIKEMKKDDKLNEELLFIINETREETEWRIIWRHLKFVEDKLKSNDMKIYSAFYGQVFYFNMEQKDFIKKLLFIIESIYSIYFTIFWGNRPPITGSFPAFGIVGPSSDIGLSTCITNDKWTDKDSLGYDIYAHAIYKFIIHEDTKAPFTISIQAPWGGGKTSLMRMLQKLLDPKALKDKTEEVSTNKLTVKDLYKELRLLNAEEKLNSWWSAIKRFINYPNEKSNYLKDNLEGTKLTVWLNVWKYENTQQIWAGLADAIVRQISERMDTVEREKFLFYLKYKRLDVNKIRDKIHNAIFQRLYTWILPLLTIFLIYLLYLYYSYPHNLAEIGFRGLLGLIIEGIVFVGTYFYEKNVIANEPAQVNLNEYVEMPDYNGNLGFVHYVEEDLKKVFNIIPKKYKPVVIFIDDLDRCSPQKVADVIEGINLFLGGEFENCIFILGMEEDIVAAALEEAHSKLIDRLNKHSIKKSPIGCRFMEKFVQLQFFIPPPEKNSLENFIKSSLFNNEKKLQVNQKLPTTINTTETSIKLPEVIEDILKTNLSIENIEDIEKKLPDIIKKHNLPDEIEDELKNELIKKSYNNIIEQYCKNFSDQEAKIRDILLNIAPEITGNPRELKRFFNKFRFLYFMKMVCKEHKGQIIFPETLALWVLLTIKWPAFTDWLRKVYMKKKWAKDEAPLEIIEDITEKSKNFVNWKTALSNYIIKLENLTPPWVTYITDKSKNLEDWEKAHTNYTQFLESNKPSWINDESLMNFFKKEVQVYFILKDEIIDKLKHKITNNERLKPLKPLKNKKFSQAELTQKLEILRFNKQEIELILGYTKDQLPKWQRLSKLPGKDGWLP